MIATLYVFTILAIAVAINSVACLATLMIGGVF